MSLPCYVVFGEALTDFILQPDQLWRACPGGSCWNVARVGARAGIATAFAGTVSQDVFGDQLYRQAEAAGLDMRFMHQVPYAPLLAMVPSIEPPRYFFVGENSADLQFDPSRLPEGWMDAVEIAHFGCISLARQPLAARLTQLACTLKSAGKRIAFDPNFRATMDTPDYHATLETMAGLADYIKVSEEDLSGLFPGQETAGGLSLLRAMAPEAVILLTRGAHGMTLIQGDQILDQPAFRVEVRDTVGCGDAAMGGWIASMLQTPCAPPAHHLRQAAASAACAASHDGAYPATEEDIRAVLRTSPLQATTMCI